MEEAYIISLAIAWNMTSLVFKYRLKKRSFLSILFSPLDLFLLLDSGARLFENVIKNQIKCI